MDIIEVLRPSLDLAVLLVIICDEEADVKGRFDLAWLTSFVPPFDRVGVNGCWGLCLPTVTTVLFRIGSPPLTLFVNLA